MLADLLFAVRRGVDQIAYWCHTYLPLNRWRRPTNQIIAVAREEAARYGIERPRIDRRRAYQVARVVVTDRLGDHLVDLVPDAWAKYAPTSCAKTHSGKKKFAPLSERRDAFRRHPQTLAYLLTPPALAREGVGGSARGTLVGISLDEAAPPAGAVAQRIREISGVAGNGDLDAYAELVARLLSGPAERAEEPEAA